MSALECLASLCYTVLFVAGVLYITGKIRYWITDYRFSPDGIQMVMFGGRLKTKRIPRERIREAVITGPYDIRLLSPTVMNLTNGITGPRLLVRSTGMASYNLSPRDPEAALKALQLHHHG